VTDTAFRSADLPGRLRATSVQEALATDRGNVPAGLREEFNDFVGGRHEVDVARYLTQEFCDLEFERLWSRVWQWACRLDQLREVGDHVVYEIGNTSLIVVRSSPTEIRAFHNACLHRGRTLCDEDGRTGNFRCAFHGFTWGLDGRLKHIPERWDFEHIDWDEFCLPEARVDTWGGFVFVNLDLEAAPLAEYLGTLPEHLAPWDFEHRYTAVHLGMHLDANWKVAHEAFLENMHAVATHSQALPCLGDSNMQYDAAYSQGHWGRMIALLGVPSPHLAADRISEQRVLDAMSIMFGPHDMTVPDGMTAREHAADVMRANLHAFTGVDYNGFSDSEMIDLIVYTLFPNFLIFGGVGGLTYRFRPWDTDPRKCFWEIFIFLPAPDGAPKPAPASMRVLAPGEGWDEAPELGVVGAFLQQDVDNIPHIQRGLEATTRTNLVLSNYLESLVRHFHDRLDQYLARP
jgi:phenylpropionate dioxygenase-like ring-hydroxylating dioxygenase large terminal subunit